ncbi:MAG TPA: hypothetical protein VNU01_09900 [Egibacteraceae bacterium]|nr:hypothetical protein [Egibacteraceae bacterium]
MRDPAVTIRHRVEQHGGRLAVSVREIRDTFGLSRLTLAGRQRIITALVDAGLTVDPAFTTAALDDLILLTSAHRVARVASAPPLPTEPRPPRTPAGPAGEAIQPPNGKRPTKRFLVIAALAVVALVVVVATLSAPRDETSASTAPGTTPRTIAAATRPAPAQRARLLLARAERAAARDRLDVAEGYLARVPAEIEAQDPVVAQEIARARVIVDRTRRYLAGERSGRGGRYARAARTMKALGGFRDAPQKARAYSRKHALVLVSQARRDLENDRPGQALAKLGRAEGWSPLPAISVLRRQVRERQAQLARPTPPEPTTASSSECDPSYQGACLDPSSPDYDCAGGSGDGPDYTGPVQVVGPDRFGLDRDGDGYACE